jgi:hypothetical protein
MSVSNHAFGVAVAIFTAWLPGASVRASGPAPVAIAPSSVERAVTTERGHVDVTFSGLPVLASPRYVTTELVRLDEADGVLAPDPTPGSAFDDLSQVRWRYADNAFANLPARVEATASTTGAAVVVIVGRDIDADRMPDAGEEVCRGTTGGSSTCRHETTTTRGFWIVTQVVAGAAADVLTESHVLGLSPCVPCADVPFQKNGAMVATGPGSVPAGAAFPVRLGWDVPGLTAGRTFVGELRIERIPGEIVAHVPVRLRRSGTTFEPVALVSERDVRVILRPGQAHERMFIDVPPGTSLMRVLASPNRNPAPAGYGVTLHVAYAGPAPAGPQVGTAPPRDTAGVRVGTSVIIDDPAPGRWFVTPVGTGAAASDTNVNALFYNDSPNIRRGSYYNPARGGHGVFVYPAGTQRAMLWYTYLQDGSPTWYYAQAKATTGDSSWTSPVYRAAWDGAGRTLTPIGSVVLTPRDAAGGITMSYTIDGFTGSETLDPWLTGCPMHDGQPLDVSAHWFDPASPGYGYTAQVVPGYEFFAAFVYDGRGAPRFLVAERPGPFDAGGGPLNLDQLRGFAPLGPHAPPVRTTVGTFARGYGAGTLAAIGTEATFVDGVPGTWARSGETTPLTGTQGCAP